MPPTLKRPAYHVWMVPDGADPDAVQDDELELHHVVVNHGDQLRAELEANKLGLAKAGTGTPMHLTALWIWAALVRTGRFDGKFQDQAPNGFKARCIGYEPDRDRDQPHDDPDADQDDLDARPTEASTSSG
jgi:hypothetical protein